MTVPADQTRQSGPYVGNDVATSFAFDYKVFAETDVRVVLTTSADDTQVDLVLNADYSVTLNADQNADPGGSITYPLSGSPLASTHSLTLIGNTPAEQPADLQNMGGFLPEVIEDVLDRCIAVAQQIKRDFAGAATYAVAAAASAVQAAASAASALAQAVAAAASAATAAVSATSAASSATAATTARDAALLARGVFATTAKALSKGVAGTASLVGGAGGTDGTFDLAFSGGAGSGAAGRFVVAGGAVVSIVLTASGDSYTSAPAISFAASAGLVGASATAVIANNVDPGEYFLVPVAGSNDALILYQDVAGVATEITRIPSTALVDFLSEYTIAGISLAETDLDGNAVRAVTNAAQANPLVTALPAAPTFDGTIHHVVSYGQSLSLGWQCQPAISTAQRDESLMFNGGVRPFDGGAAPGIYASLQPLVESNDGSVSGETPLAVMFETIWDVLQRDHAIAQPDEAFRFLGSCAGKDGVSIDLLKKPGTYYSRFLEQITYGLSLSVAAGYSYRAPAFLWLQGEYDQTTMSQADYLSKLRTLRSDLEADINTITGRSDTLLCILYQTYGTEAEANNPTVSLAQLQAATEEPDKFAMAQPMYPFTTYDGVHFGNLSSGLMGAYMGLVYKRAVLENATWLPIYPLRAVRSGANIDVTFNVPQPPLVFEDKLVGVLTNYGFRVVDSGGSNLTVNSVSLVSSRTVRITCAAAVPSGARVRYGWNNSRGDMTAEYARMRRVSGGAVGALRDSQGEVYYSRRFSQAVPLHNYCSIFDQVTT